MTEEDASPRERRYQRTQQAILTAARTILAEGGAEALSIRAIADRIDYSPAGLYEYYGSKEEIISALCWEGHQTLRRFMEQVPLTLAPAEYLRQTGIAYIQFARQNPDLFLLIFTTQGPLPNDHMDAPSHPTSDMMEDESGFPLLLNGIQRAAQQGVVNLLPGMSLFETAYAFWAIVHGAAMLRITSLANASVDFDRADHLMLAAFIRGMGTEA